MFSLKKNRLTLLVVNALFLSSVSAFSVYSQSASAEDVSNVPVIEELVNMLTKLAHGPHAGYRAFHAKGIMAKGDFTPSPSASSLSLAPFLQSTTTPVLVRFSNGTGVPNIGDADPNGMPKGIAIRFQLSDGAISDMVCISVNSFPAATPEDFLGLLNAVAASGPDVEKPTPVEQFLDSHPAALRFVKTPKPAPISFATQAFYGVNAFKFTNAKGESRYGRYRITPINGTQYLSDDQAAKAAPDYLMDELPTHLSKAEAKFKISVQLAEKGDIINDGTEVWSEDRQQIELGVLTLKATLPDSKQVEKTLMFSPLNLTDGIVPSEDPILLARPASYAVSFGRRLGH